MDESKKISTKKFLEDNANEIKKMLSSSITNMEEEKIKDIAPVKVNSTIIFNKISYIKDLILEDFKILKILGRGTFGKVYLVQYKQEKDFYAMKSIEIEYLENQNEIKEILLDKNIIQDLNYPFLIGTEICFITDNRIYFIMNLIQGESLLNYMMINKNIQEEEVKFYAAIIGLTIDYLHKNGITVRDIRPDEIMIEKDGYLKIEDYKLGKLFKIKKNALNMKETSEYLSPEEINKNKKRLQADWWTYGIIIYELLFGIPPFLNEDDREIRESIVKDELKFPKNTNVSKNAKELIKKLLIKNPESRLGHSKGFEDIKKQEFFKGFNFDDLINKKMEARYKPNIGDILKDKEKKVEVSYDDLVNSKILIK